jgi:hypothetical protein
VFGGNDLTYVRWIDNAVVPLPAMAARMLRLICPAFTRLAEEKTRPGNIPDADGRKFQEAAAAALASVQEQGAKPSEKWADCLPAEPDSVNILAAAAGVQ